MNNTPCPPATRHATSVEKVCDVYLNLPLYQTNGTEISCHWGVKIGMKQKVSFSQWQAFTGRGVHDSALEEESPGLDV